MKDNFLQIHFVKFQIKVSVKELRFATSLQVKPFKTSI